MELGNQIKALRRRRGITQETMAQHLGITPQAISKWERGVTTPDIAILPDISAYFGVTIDELFALSDDTRMQRIENMLCDERYLNPSDVLSTREFLLEKGRREHSNGKVYELLADMENHLSEEHREKAAEYAKIALERDPTLRDAHYELTRAMHGKGPDWNGTNHYLLINFYKEFIQKHPDCGRAYLWIMDQLIDDYRLTEAEQYCDQFAMIDQSYRVPLYRGIIQWQLGNRDTAFEIWKKMEQDFPQEWCVWHHLGDYLTWIGKYDTAMVYYRRALDIQTVPPLLDPLQAIAQLCEIRGDYAGAILARNEEAERMRTQWNISTGEEYDQVLRDIERLTKISETR